VIKRPVFLSYITSTLKSGGKNCGNSMNITSSGEITNNSVLDAN
jgi:hypothetical protein